MRRKGSNEKDGPSEEKVPDAENKRTDVEYRTD
jgi:hypothetical protein